MSPVIGVILMVAITVILAAVIGTFVLGLGDQVQTTAPSASFNFDYTDHSGNDLLVISHNGGDTIAPGKLSVKSDIDFDYNKTGGWDGSTYASRTFSQMGYSNDVQAGTSVTVGNVDLETATVRVIWSAESGDSSAVLGEWTGPEA